MASKRQSGSASRINRKLRDAAGILKDLGFGPRQSNDTAAYVLLALLDLLPSRPWSAASNPLRGITPMIEFIRTAYKKDYAPNTRETIRDEAVKHFVESGLLLRNPDKPDRPTNSGNTVYQIEPSALSLFKCFGTDAWDRQLLDYQASRSKIRAELSRRRNVSRIPVVLPTGDRVTLSPGGQNPLIKLVIEEFCERFVPGAVVVYIGDAERKFLHYDVAYLNNLDVVIAPSAKMPDVVVHDTKRNWLLIVEAVVSAGPIDPKRRMELKALFQRSKAGLVFVTAFEDRTSYGRFHQQIAWETEVWIASDPDHIIHLNGERFLGPYPDVAPS